MSREEQPVEIKDKPAGVVYPQGQDPSQSSSPSLGSGIVGTEPKRVRTIAIHPDQSAAADATRQQRQLPRRRAQLRQRRPDQCRRRRWPVILRLLLIPNRRLRRASRWRVLHRRLRTRLRRQHRAMPHCHSALMLRLHGLRRRPALPRPRAHRGGGTDADGADDRKRRHRRLCGAGLLAAQRSRSAGGIPRSAGQVPGQLGGKQPLIHHVDLGDKGIYYRAMVGPFANGSEAMALCSSLKACWRPVHHPEELARESLL